MATPEHAQAMIREAQRLQRLDRIPEAIQAYERVLEQWPDLADCWFNLGVLQRKARRLSAALASYQNALDRGIAGAEEVHLNRSVIYSDYLRQDEAAERELQRALSLNPAYLPALLNLANLYEDLGRRAEAAVLYERMLALQPLCFEALARYANLQILPLADTSLERRLRVAIAHPRASEAERASLGFALGRLLDGRGEYRSAFEVYVAANRASRASAGPHFAGYDRARQEQLTQRLLAGAVVPANELTLQTSTPRPIFICGMFRSGSTLAEQLLAGHPDVASGGELDILPRIVAELAPFPESMADLRPEQAARLARRYLEEARELFPAAGWVTDKRLDNFLSIFFLHLDQGMSYALDLLDIGHYYREYRRLMAHWQDLFGADLFEFNYDRFVREPQRTAAELFAFLGLEWDERYLARPLRGSAVRTASVWQVREPLHARSSGRARHYASQLTALRDYLADLLPR